MSAVNNSKAVSGTILKKFKLCEEADVSTGMFIYFPISEFHFSLKLVGNFDADDFTML